jgi:hypothetical protein
MRNGLPVELHVADLQKGHILTERMDVYLGVILTVMFLAGCFLVVVATRERTKARSRGERG